MNTDMQILILKRASQKGLNLSRLSPAEYRKLAMEVRSIREKARDGGKALKSLAKTKILRLTVVPEKAAENERICRENTCGKFRTLIRGGSSEPACDFCNCSSKWLRSKWQDGEQSCPLGLWTNRDTGTPQEEKPLSQPAGATQA